MPLPNFPKQFLYPFANDATENPWRGINRILVMVKVRI